MTIQTEINKLEITDSEVFADGVSIAKGKLSFGYTDNAGDSAFNMDALSQSPEIGKFLVVFLEGEEHPVYVSSRITAIS